MPTTPPHIALQRLLELLQIEPTGSDAADRFRGQSQDLGTPAVFGGQVLGQALAAACRCVPADRRAHSLHAYFLRPGRHLPIDYEVERVRDGGSFCTRRVVALQEGTPIFELLASFQQPEQGLDRHEPMPSLPGPDGVRSEVELRRALTDRLPPPLRDKLIMPTGIEYRPLVPFELMDATPREARSSVWLRSPGPVPDDPVLHQALLAYASDHGLLITSLLPHGLNLLKGEVQLASIDHSMWFHRDFRIDDWLLYQVDSPNVCGNRALCRGSFYSRDGRLVATTVQEGLMRLRR